MTNLVAAYMHNEVTPSPAAPFRATPPAATPPTATPPAAAARPPPHRPPPHHHITTPPHRPPRHRLTATPPLAQIREFEKIIKQNARTILGDPFIKLYIEDLLKNIRTQVRPTPLESHAAAPSPCTRPSHLTHPMHPACQPMHPAPRLPLDAPPGATQGHH